MKTFADGDNNSIKRFQKPNILRKRSKPPLRHSISESRSVKSLVPTSTEQEPKLTILNQCVNKNISSLQRLIVDSNVSNEENSIGELYQIDGNVDMDRSLAVTCDVLTNNNEENVFEATVNVDSFINNSEMEQMVTQADVENDLSRRMKKEWCLDFINDTQEIIIEDIDGSHLGSLRLASSPNSSAALDETSSPRRPHAVEAPTQNITLEYMNCTMNFKCNIPNCSKRFRSEEALNKHRSTHTKAAKVKVGSKSDKPVLIECPVKKVFANGVEQRCGVHYTSKKDIINHLNEAHDPTDAMYICAECGRRFYWAAGLRAHSRTHSRGDESGAWACSWAGCGRVFRQPCRLREHMRAHTGDKPYPCRHPNCGWSFRTASKLLRHARRHTGERRHACEECGRAFRRREHLRDHAARHHAHKRACTHTGCQKKFNTVEALQTHLERVHNEFHEIAELYAATEPDTPYISSQELQPEQPFTMNSPALCECKLEEVETTSIPTNVHTEAVVKMEHQTVAETGMSLQAGDGSMCLTDTEAGMMLQTDAEAGMILQTDAEAGMMLQNDTEAGMMLQTDAETGLMLQTDTVTGLMHPDTETGLMLTTDTEAGMVIQSDTEAGMVLQSDTKPRLMVQAGSGRAARTHCTWPFAARPPEEHFDEHANQEYVLDDDATVEISERSDSNIYTIRSDLFLHGNVLNNEDSEQMGGAGTAGEGEGEGEGEGAGAGRVAELLVVGADSLLNAHPTIDLIQEELLYTDAAVDESSFRVFLLSGEELG